MPKRKPTRRPTGGPSTTKVFWSAAERMAIVSSAADIQAESPELAGLPLIRQAMMKLAADRRRKLDTMNQVPWFEKALRDEIRRRQAIDTGRPAAVTIVQSDEVALGLLRTLVEEAVKQTQMLSRIAFGGGAPPTLAEAQAAGMVSSAPALGVKREPAPNGNTSALRRLVMRGTNGTRRPN